jgi:hypothetical protein
MPPQVVTTGNPMVAGKMAGEAQVNKQMSLIGLTSGGKSKTFRRRRNSCRSKRKSCRRKRKSCRSRRKRKYVKYGGNIQNSQVNLIKVPSPPPGSSPQTVDNFIKATNVTETISKQSEFDNLASVNNNNNNNNNYNYNNKF